MQYYSRIEDIPKFERPIITIGSFDGLHQGHQRILKQVQALAAERNTEHVIITFDPHPRQIIYPRDQTLQLLTDLEEKKRLMEYYGVKHLAIIPFTIEFSQLNADEYVENFLVRTFNPGVIVIGYDHKFGLNRQGDINYLKWYGQKHQFEVIEIPPQEVDDIAVSSSKIRRALGHRDIPGANTLLGHPYFLTGKVVHGNNIGQKIGFPTANIQPANPLKLIPPDGIYAVCLHLQDEGLPAVLYVGNKPTLGHQKITIEVHIMNFDRIIYDEEVTIEWVQFIRVDQKFDSIESMAVQIGKDKEKAQEILASYTSHIQLHSPTPNQ